MKTSLLLMCGMLAGAEALADPGILLNWDDCSAGGASYKTFACDRNDARHTLVLSFRAPEGIGLFNGVEAEVLFYSNSPALPDWWRLRNQTGQTDQCRNGALTTNSYFAEGPYSCTDPYGGQGVGGIANYQVGHLGDPKRARLQILHAMPAGNEHPLTYDEEYYAAKVVIDSRKTTGAGACGGCNEVLGVWFSYLKVVQPPGSPGGDVLLTSDNAPERNFAGWQGECFISCWCGPGSCGCGIQCTTPAVRHTWGTIKSFYR